MTNTVFDPGQVAQIANEIYRIVTILDSQLKTLEATPSKRDVDYNLLEQIEMGTGILGINVTDLMSFEIPVEQRTVAMSFLGDVQKELCGLLDNFKEKALRSLEQGAAAPL